MHSFFRESKYFLIDCGLAFTIISEWTLRFCLHWSLRDSDAKKVEYPILAMTANVNAVGKRSVWTDLRDPITPAIYSTVEIARTDRWVKGCIELSGRIHTYGWSNYCDYSAKNDSCNRQLNRNSSVNRRCQRTLSDCCVIYVAN